jgi:N-acetylglucosamine malate deacetylase 2
LDYKELFEKILSGSVIDSSTNILIVASHPDDEVVGTGSLLQKIKKVSFLHSTDGAPLNVTYNGLSGTAYSELRYREFYNALKTASVIPQYHIKLGFIDQRTSFSLVELTMKMIEAIKFIKPDFIFLQPFEGGHPDHDSTTFAVHNAVELLKEEGICPKLVEYTMYFNNNGLIQTGEFYSAVKPVCRKDLNTEEQQLKKKMLDCFSSQADTLKHFHTKFEKFREAPIYNFTSVLTKTFYDLFNWGITSRMWLKNCRLASEDIKYLKILLYEYT